MGCFVSVETSTVAVIERFGKFDRFAQPGLNTYCCCTEAIVEKVNMKVQQIPVQVETKTMDNVFVNVQIIVQYRIDSDKIFEAVYKLNSPKEQITAYVQNVVRSCIPTMTLDHVFQEKNKIAEAVRDELEKVMGEAGYIIVGTLVTDVDPAAAVKSAMNEINTQERLRVAAATKAEAAKIAQIKAAEADAESKHLSGVGLANQRKAIVDGLSSSIKEFSEAVPGSSPQEVMELVMMNQYFDTLKELAIGSKNNTIFIPHSPASVTELARQIQNGFAAGHTHHE